MNLQMTTSTYPAQWLSTSDLANTRRKRRSRPPLFNVSEQTIWRWVKQGYFPEPKYIGGKAFWSAEEVSEFIESSPTGRASG